MSRRIVHTNHFVIGLWAVLTISGCDSKPSNLAQVSGLVTLDGKPIPGSLVQFLPVAVGGKAPGPVSTGRCDEEGRYTLKTIEGDTGAVIGNHLVKIFSYSPEVAPGPYEEPEKEKFPMKFNVRTQLSIDVPESGLEKANFELTTK